MGIRIESRAAARPVAGAPAWRRVAPRALLYLALVVGALPLAVPLAWLISTSLKPEADVFLFPPNLIPSSFEWINYPEALAPSTWAAS